MGERQLGQHPVAQVVVLAASTQLCGCFGPHRFHNADLGKVDPLRLPVACEPTEERNVVLRLLLRRPGQRPNEGAIGSAVDIADSLLVRSGGEVLT